MAKITISMLDDMKTQHIVPFATASKDGVPNVVPIGMIFMKEQDTFWIVDNFFDKTIKNLKENPHASFYIWHPKAEQSYQVKGDVVVENSGKDYEEAVAFAHSKGPNFPAKNLVKFKVTDVYYVTPGPNAGKKVE